MIWKDEKYSCTTFYSIDVSRLKECCNLPNVLIESYNNLAQIQQSSQSEKSNHPKYCFQIYLKRETKESFFEKLKTKKNIKIGMEHWKITFFY